MFGRVKPIIGLDIGSHSIKAVVLDKVKSGLVLKNMGLAQLPPEAIIDGVVQEQDLVVTTIKNLLKSLKVKAKNVCNLHFRLLGDHQKDQPAHGHSGRVVSEHRG